MYYFSLQYSAIQKTVLRHDRLWSIAGLSHLMSELNEIRFPEIASSHGGHVIVAGGGKFTASFDDDTKAGNAKKEIVRLLSTTLPMLEFQITEEPVEAADFAAVQKADNGKNKPGIIHALDEHKRCFRGYGVTYNPYLEVCGECKEYPAVRGTKIGKKEACSVCASAKEKAAMNPAELVRIPDGDAGRHSTIRQIYRNYFRSDGLHERAKEGEIVIPLNLDALFPKDKEGGETKGRRVAVWASDMNNMGDKVKLWLRQDEKKALDTFVDVTTANIEIVSTALLKTFTPDTLVKRWEEEEGTWQTYNPFRLIVAGGDDLCLVMPEKHIIAFTLNLCDALNEKRKEIEKNPDHPLNIAWLKTEAEKYKLDTKKDDISVGPFCFGGSFIVTSVHTPFRKIHEASEDLMKEAKKKTGRAYNSVNWRVLLVDGNSDADALLPFQKPLGIDEKYNGWRSFDEFNKLLKNSLTKKLSASHLHQVIGWIMESKGDARLFEKKLKRTAEAAKKDSAMSQLLSDEFRGEDGQLDMAAITTLCELLTIGGEVRNV